MKFLSWSPSRLADYDQCPLMAQHRHILKTCPSCFKGRLKGGYGTVAKCPACGHQVVDAPPLQRGTDIGKNLEMYVSGVSTKVHREIKHPVILALAKKLRTEFKKKLVQVERLFCFDKNWAVLGEGWSPKIWLIAKLDVLRFNGHMAEVIDWKSGGVDKYHDNKVRAEEKYDDQLNLYNVAALAALPKIVGVNSQLAFVDCGAAYDPIVKRDGLARKDLKAAFRKWEKRVEPMMNDDTFAPSPSPKCLWCPYSKDRGGPCPFAGKR